MKEVHLICNAHLDPIWQWEWEEGAAAALSTFRAAADLADRFDYIFCNFNPIKWRKACCNNGHFNFFGKQLA